jgi:hypothetical protein
MPASLAAVLFLALVSTSNGDGPDEYSFKVDSNLRVAVAKVDISPPDGTLVTGPVRPTKGFRDRLHVAESLRLADRVIDDVFDAFAPIKLKRPTK